MLSANFQLMPGLGYICSDFSLSYFGTLASGCFHNSTMFADTSIIPSTEPCLLCKCSNKNLVCVRRVCKDQVMENNNHVIAHEFKHKTEIVISFWFIPTQPYPPPRSCILVHKKSLCCPYLSCSKYHINFYKNSERNREHVNRLQVNHEKTLEKSSRTDDGGEETSEGEERKNERMKEWKQTKHNFRLHWKWKFVRIRWAARCVMCEVEFSFLIDSLF